MLTQMLFPPPPRPEQVAGDPAFQAGDDVLNGGNLKQLAGEGGPLPLVADSLAADEAQLDAEAADAPAQYLTLGSVNPESGYRLLVTLSSQGAAVERIELASPRYRDLTDRGGYLGHVATAGPSEEGQDTAFQDTAFQDTEPGVLVQVVGAGTPAAAAGLQPGDRILSIDTKSELLEINSADDLSDSLSKTKPGQTVELRVVRESGAPRTMTATLGRRPLEVIRPEAENLKTRKGEIPVDFQAPASFLLKLGKTGEDKLIAPQMWEVVESDGSSVTFRRTLPGQQIELIKRYSLKAVPEDMRDKADFPGYDLDLDVEIRNVGDAPKAVNYTLSGPNGLPIEGWWYAHKISRGWSAAGLRDVVVRFYGSQAIQHGCSKIAADKVDPMGQGESLAYAAVDSQYFAVALMPKKESATNVWFGKTEVVRVGPKPAKNIPKTYTNASFNVERKPTQIEAGESLRDSYRIFAGPKRPELLKEYYSDAEAIYTLSDLVYYGWFGSVAKLMLNVLHVFYGIVGNYGIAIVMLTILVRACMFPLSYKQTKNMARMQALKPELDRITEKYKNDAQKKQQAMQQLYTKNQINPLSGCLPLFIQMPMFMGLYRGLMIDIELRQSPLFSSAIAWCSNLAAPDMLYDWSGMMPSAINNGVGIFGLGPYLNVLPLVSVGLFLVSQKMFMPPPTNDQAAMQQNMMKYMTLFMGLIFYKVAAGLCIYLIVSSLWGIVERKLLPKPATSGESETAKPAIAKVTPASKKALTSSANGASNTNGSPKSKKRKKNKRKK